MKRTVAILALSVILAAGCEIDFTDFADSNCGAGGSRYGAIEGHVFAGECAACSAFVTLNGPSSWCTRTDSLGFYHISQPQGRYEICAYYEGFAYYEDSVTLTYIATLSLDIRLIEDTAAP